MSTNPFKAFIPYLVNSGAALSEPERLASSDPSGGQWRSMGLCEPIKGEGLRVNLEAGVLMAVQFNERILPGKVRDEQLVKEAAKLEAAEGRKLTKKEYAQLRDQTEFDLLPKAFIRRTVVHVGFVKQSFGVNYMLVFTSSQKRADDCVALMHGAFSEALAPWKIETTSPITGNLTTLARDGLWRINEENDPSRFYSGDCAVLKGDNKKTIRIKDKALEEGDIQTLLEQDYVVHEVGVLFGDSADEPDLTFVVNDNLTFKRLDIPNVKSATIKADLFGHAVLCLQGYKKMLNEFFEAVGGMTEKPEVASSAGTNDEDEL